MPDLQYSNIRQFNMVINSGQLHCFCMGHILSRHHTGKEGNHRKFNFFKCFYYSIFIFVKQFDKSKRNIFRWCCYGGSFNHFPMDNRWDFKSHWENKKMDCFRNDFSTCCSIYIYHQHHAIKNDRNSYS